MNSSNKKMKLLAGLFCLAIASSELKSVKLNHPHGTSKDPVLLLESGNSMTLSHHSGPGSSQWILPNGDIVKCNNRTRSGRFSVTCEKGNSTLTALNLTTCDAGDYSFRAEEGSSGAAFEYKVEIIKVSVSASMDDGCKSVNIVAHIDSKNYELKEMTSPSLHEDIQQFHHPFLFSITTKNLRFGRHELNVTIRKKNTSDVQYVNTSVTLNESVRCSQTAKGDNNESSDSLRAASSSVKSNVSAFPLMGLLSRLCLLYVLQYMLNCTVMRPVFVEFG